MTSQERFGRYGRVILTYGRSLMSLVAAQSLTRHGIEVIGCDSVDLTALRFSRYSHEYFVHPDPNVDEDEYMRRMVEMIERFRPDAEAPYILMPMFDNGRILSRRRAELPDFVTLAAPRWESIERVYPKDRLVRTIESMPGLAPRSAVIDNEEDLMKFAADFQYPLVIKPADGVGGRGVAFADDESALRNAFEENTEAFDGPFVLQETAPGEDYCMTAIARDGQVCAAMAYKNLETFPNKSGAGSVRETVDHEPFMKATGDILRATEWDGVVEIDFRWDGDAASTPQLIEVNARFWAGLYHSMESGIDYPWLLYQLAAYGEIAETPASKIGVRTKTPVLSTLSAFSAVASRSLRLSAARRLFAKGWRKLGEGRFGQGAGSISRAIAGVFSFDRAAFVALEKADQNREASGEFDHANDPFAGLGFLFILSSLLRYGKLPDEIKY